MRTNPGPRTLVLASTPFATVTLTHTRAGPRILDPKRQRTWPGQPVILDLGTAGHVSRPLLALAREATLRAPFVVVVGGSESVREGVAAALLDTRQPGLCFTWPPVGTSPTRG